MIRNRRGVVNWRMKITQIACHTVRRTMLFADFIYIYCCHNLFQCNDLACTYTDIAIQKDIGDKYWHILLTYAKVVIVQEITAVALNHLLLDRTIY